MNASSLILIGVEESGSFTFRPTRGFMNNPAGLTEARQYVNMIVEAHPYEQPPLAMVVPLGLTGDVPAELTRDRAVSIGELFPIEVDEKATEEALAALRAKLEAPVDPWLAHATCAENRGMGECALPMRTDHDGKARCAVHTHDATHCANYAQGFGACFGPVHADGDNGELLCEKHSNDENKEK